MTDVLEGVYAVVVHYRNHETLVQTVRGLVDEGLGASRIIVVDNSENPQLLENMRERVPDDVTILTSRNRGYGAAANVGLGSLPPEAELVLVCTHEFRFHTGGLRSLAAAMGELGSSCGAAGPLLRNAETGRTWSSGGVLSRFLRVPRHLDHDAPFEPLGGASEVMRRVEWLDGAGVLYRRAALERRRFDETFGLYLEEVDLHLHLQDDGYSIFCVRTSVADQSSHGMPPYWSARNYFKMLKLRSGLVRSLAAASFEMARGSARDVARVRLGNLADRARGLVAHRADPDLIIVNPLGAALGHYEASLRQTFTSRGGRVSTLSAVEPGSSGSSKAGYLLRYCLLLLRARRQSEYVLTPRKVLLTWPVMNYLGVVLARVLAGPRLSVIVHDPKPLSGSQAGISTHWLRLLPARVRPELIVHSTAAEADLLQRLRRSHVQARVTLLPHPILKPRRNASPSASAPTIRVLGQFKPDRDLGALAEIAETESDWRLEIVGRGWPALSGWSVRDEFVPESEFEALLRSSNVVVIPYSKFYQSGVAIQCLETGVPFVGPAATSLEQLVPNPELLATPGGWAPAVDRAVRVESDAFYRHALTIFQVASETWERWFVDDRPGLGLSPSLLAGSANTEGPATETTGA